MQRAAFIFIKLKKIVKIEYEFLNTLDKYRIWKQRVFSDVRKVT